MCKGTATTMTCGHLLLHHTSRCKSSVRNQKLCRELQGPRERIDDTCARCHPPHIISKINRHYDELLRRLMIWIKCAKTKEEVLEIQTAIEEVHAQKGRELRAASRLQWNGEVVWILSGERNERLI
ncbi:hypothetical protein BKA65DRAFT_107588 [Rhexocercosporidium sp. MPI-PUGE-AT-0058]|nr:hypothetical protein BKA65DRAFT_107588 [Rhexocercosporidium sp. MPI-PUGE-AT-0058]